MPACALRGARAGFSLVGWGSVMRCGGAASWPDDWEGAVWDTLRVARHTLPLRGQGVATGGAKVGCGTRRRRVSSSAMRAAPTSGDGVIHRLRRGVASVAIVAPSFVKLCCAGDPSWAPGDQVCRAFVARLARATGGVGDGIRAVGSRWLDERKEKARGVGAAGLR
mgnify:CR=1 FL=1